MVLTQHWDFIQLKLLIFPLLSKKQYSTVFKLSFSLAMGLKVTVRDVTASIQFASIQFVSSRQRGRVPRSDGKTLQCNCPPAFCIHCLLLFIEAKLPRCEKAGEEAGTWWLQKPQKLINCSSPEKFPDDDELIKAELKFQGVCKRTGIFFSSLKQYFIQICWTFSKVINGPTLHKRFRIRGSPLLTGN